MPIIFLFLLFIFAPSIPLKAASQEADYEKPKTAFIRIINACDTSQSQRWLTGLDLQFKEHPIGRDIRLGERGPIGRIDYNSRDFVEVFRSGNHSKPLTKIPASFQANGFYTLVVFGNIEASMSNVNVEVIENYPMPLNDKKPSQCRIVFFNAVKAYPVSLSIGNNETKSLEFGKKFETFLPPGEFDVGIWFKDREGNIRRLQSGMIVDAGGNYTAIIHPSEERGDRPALFKVNTTEDRRNVIESTKENQKDS